MILKNVVSLLKKIKFIGEFISMNSYSYSIHIYVLIATEIRQKNTQFWLSYSFINNVQKGLISWTKHFAGTTWGKKPNVTHRSSFSRHKGVNVLLDNSAFWSRP